MKIKKIKKEAVEIKEILSKCKTIKDVNNLRHINAIGLSDIMVEISPEEGLEELNPDMKPETEVTGIRVSTYGEFLDFPTYYREKDSLYFDVFDKEVDEEYAFLEDVTLATLEEAYANFFAQKKQREIGCFSADVILLDNGLYDVYLSHEGSSGRHYTNVTASRIGELLADDIECIAKN